MQVLARFVVYGQPRPKGSKTTFITDSAMAKAMREGRKPFPISKEANSTTAWVRLVSQVMAEVLEWREEGPVALDVTFYFPRPKSRAGYIWHVTAPDADKLLRAIGDAGNRVAWDDDKVIAYCIVPKLYTDGPARAVVTVGLPDEGDLPPEPPEI